MESEAYAAKECGYCFERLNAKLFVSEVTRTPVPDSSVSASHLVWLLSPPLAKRYEGTRSETEEEKTSTVEL